MPGRLYALRLVAAVLGVSADTVLNRVKKKLLAPVVPKGSTHHYFDGAEVLRYWRASGLAVLPPPVPPTAMDKKRRVAAARKELERMGAI